MMVGGKNRDIKPLLLKVGVAFALSFAGFLFSRLKTRKMKPSLPPPRSPCSSGLSSHFILISFICVFYVFSFCCCCTLQLLISSLS